MLVLPGTVAAADPGDECLVGGALRPSTALPLLIRRRWPFVTLGLITLAATDPAGRRGVHGAAAGRALHDRLAALVGGDRRARPARSCSSASSTASPAGPQFTDGDLFGLAFLCVVGSGAGLYVGTRRARAVAQRERAVADERLRIAQELHDVVAHNVSLIVVQAQALGATAGDEHVREATDGIADLGRQTMKEMHRTLKLLRGDDAAELAPQPGLGELPELLERARTAGVGIELAVEGEPRPLAQSVDLSAYRIVQEALTNVVKHAGRAHTKVTLGYRPDALELTIADSGNGAPSAASPGGHGLVGMRERAALFGGTLTAGPRDGHGFEVRASLPYGGAS